MPNPQQPELRRSGTDAVDDDAAPTAVAGQDTPDGRPHGTDKGGKGGGRGGGVPPGQQSADQRASG